MSSTRSRPAYARGWVALAAATAALLAGCVSDRTADPTANPRATAAASGTAAGTEADQILADAAAALSEVEAFQVSGEGTEAGQAIALDMAFLVDRGARGTITVDGQALELVAVDGTTYVKATEAFLGGQGVPDLAVERLAGKWLLFPAEGAEGLPEFTDPDRLVASLLEPDGTITVGETKDIDGQEAVALVDEGDYGGTLWISTETSLPVRLEPQEASATGQLDFTYDVDVSIEEPPADEVVDFSALLGGALGSGGDAG